MEVGGGGGESGVSTQRACSHLDFLAGLDPLRPPAQPSPNGSEMGVT